MTDPWKYLQIQQFVEISSVNLKISQEHVSQHVGVSTETPADLAALGSLAGNSSRYRGAWGVPW